MSNLVIIAEMLRKYPSITDEELATTCDAFAQIEKHGLMIFPPRFNRGGVWVVRKEDQFQNVVAQVSHASLEVAIIEAVKQLTI